MLQHLDSGRYSMAGWLLPVFIGAVLLYGHLDQGLFQYDEADYMVAARQGIASNYFETNTLSMQAFLLKGLKTYLDGDLPALSREIRDAQDVNFFRHYHPPATVYLMALTDALVGPEEHQVRLFIWLVVLFTIGVIYWTLRAILPKDGYWVGSLAALLVAISPMMHTTSGMISVHSMYILIAILTLSQLTRYLQTQRLRDFYLFTGWLAIAFVVNEYALVLTVVSVLCLILVPNDLICLTRRQMRISYHLFGCLACFVGVLLLLWPGGLFKLTMIKSYIYLGYLVFVKSTLSYGSYTLLEVWGTRFMSAPVEMGLILFGLGYGIVGILTRRIDRTLLPLLAYPVIIFLANLLNRAAFNTYAVSMYPFLLMFAAMGIVTWMRSQGTRPRRTMALILLAGLVLSNGWLNRYPSREDLTPFQTAFKTIKSLSRVGDNMLVSHGYLPTVNYYLPEYDVATIYLETPGEEVATWFEQQTYRYFLFFGSPDILKNAVYSTTLSRHYKEIQRLPNNQDKWLVLFEAREE